MPDVELENRPLRLFLPTEVKDMAWPTVTKPEEMFKPAGSVAQHKTGLKVLVYGKEETWKSSFCLSFPPPIYAFDTELGMPPLFQYFIHCPVCQKYTQHPLSPEGIVGPCSVCKDTNGKMKDIRWCDATFLNPQTGMHDASVALQQLEAGIALLKDVKSGTVAIDSGTDVILSAQSFDRTSVGLDSRMAK